MFGFDSAALARLARAGCYDLGEAACVLFALRGCLPVNTADITAGPSKGLRVVEVDHRSMRCTLGVWFPQQGTLLAVPGSTVPHRSAIERARHAGGQGANQILPGLLRFAKGKHPRSGNRPQQDAFVQDADFPYQRTADDPDYDAQDPILFDRPGDNIHCAFHDTPNAPGFDSEGCLVVAGFARRERAPGSQDTGCWPRFRDTAYGSGQTRFPLILANGSEAEASVAAARGSLPLRLRFGSTGEPVRAVQSALVRLGLLRKADVDGDYGRLTVLAVRAAQRRLGLVADATCGLNTGDALGISPWPMV
ncbi:MAG: peptidoglycan-binding protein [Elioraea sp.]|nr:peptidoglycan-binding protein [Elioraea sp.]